MADEADPSILRELKRFLYLGDESKIYPKSVQFPFNPEKVQFLHDLVSSKMVPVALREILRAYREGNYLDLEPIIYSLVYVAKSSECRSRLDSLVTAREVCSSPAALLTFTHFYKQVEGRYKCWGRAHRRLLISWYNERDAKALAVDVTKVKSRHKWTHKDILCMAHVKAINPGNAAILKYLVKGIENAEKEFGSDPEAESIIKYLKGCHDVVHTQDQHTAARLIEVHDLCLEHIPPKLLCSREVALCAIKRLHLKHLLEQLPRFNRVGLLRLNSPHYKAVLERLTSVESLTNKDIDPLESFLALRKWQISNKIVPGKTPARQNLPDLEEALQRVYLESLKNFRQIGKRFLVALDTNRSMNMKKCAGCVALTPSHFSDVVLMALVRAEIDNVTTLVFSPTEVVPVGINHEMKLGDIVENLNSIAPGPTVLSAPINWALTKKMPFDTILVFTDQLSNAQVGDLSSVFTEYQKTMHLPDAKFILCTLCDRVSSFPCKEASYLNIVGFNLKFLKILQDFTCSVF